MFEARKFNFDFWSLKREIASKNNIPLFFMDWIVIWVDKDGNFFDWSFEEHRKKFWDIVPPEMIKLSTLTNK